MPFKKGQSGNAKGRVRGVKNYTTKEAKTLINTVLFGELHNIKKALKAIRAKDDYRYLDILSKLLTYSLPKKTDLTSRDEPLPASINITVASAKAAKELKDFFNGSDNK